MKEGSGEGEGQGEGGGGEGDIVVTGNIALWRSGQAMLS